MPELDPIQSKLIRAQEHEQAARQLRAEARMLSLEQAVIVLCNALEQEAKGVHTELLAMARALITEEVPF